MVSKLDAGEICTRITAFAYKDMSACEAARLMLEQHVGSLVVVEETYLGRVAIGLLTDRDIVVATVARSLNPQTISVADIMSHNLVTCHAKSPFSEVLDLMHRHGVRRIPVTDTHGVLIGIVTMDDLLEIVSEELQQFVRVFESEKRREIHTRG